MELHKAGTREYYGNLSDIYAEFVKSGNYLHEMFYLFHKKVSV
jgi:hypothetical protein